MATHFEHFQIACRTVEMGEQIARLQFDAQRVRSNGQHEACVEVEMIAARSIPDGMILVKRFVFGGDVGEVAIVVVLVVG